VEGADGVAGDVDSGRENAGNVGGAGGGGLGVEAGVPGAAGAGGGGVDWGEEAGVRGGESSGREGGGGGDGGIGDGGHAGMGRSCKATKNQAEAAAEAALASGDEAVWKKWQGTKLATAMDLVEELPEPEKIREVTLSAIDAVLPAMTKLSSGKWAASSTNAAATASADRVGCYVIARMLEDSWQVDRSIEVKAMVEKGAIQALAKAMEKHPLDEKVQDFALFALERILTLSLDVKYLTFQIPSDPSLVAAWNALESVPHDMVKAGVLELAAAAMGKYEKNEGLQAGGDVLTHQLECLQGSFESTSLVPEGIEAC